MLSRASQMSSIATTGGPSTSASTTATTSAATTVATAATGQECASYTVDDDMVTVTAEKVTIDSLSNAVKLTTTEDGQTQVSISGHRGNLVVVANADQAQADDLPDLVTQLLDQL